MEDNPVLLEINPLARQSHVNPTSASHSHLPEHINWPSLHFAFLPDWTLGLHAIHPYHRLRYSQSRTPDPVLLFIIQARFKCKRDQIPHSLSADPCAICVRIFIPLWPCLLNNVATMYKNHLVTLEISFSARCAPPSLYPWSSSSCLLFSTFAKLTGTLAFLMPLPEPASRSDIVSISVIDRWTL